MEMLLNPLVLLANFILVPGLAYGSQLALGALGVTMVYAVLNFSNFSHGEVMSFGAMVTILATYWLQSIGLSISCWLIGCSRSQLTLIFAIAASTALGVLQTTPTKSPS